MNLDHDELQHNRARSKASIVLQALLLLCAPLFVGGLWGQTSTAITSTNRDPAALAVITKALTALGGATNWQSIGAASAEVSVSRPGGPSERIQWADDWHSGYVLSRRDSSGSNGRTATTITLRDRRLRSTTGGTAQTFPRDNDLSVLALGLPAPALILSLKRPGCSFHFVNSSSYRQETPPAAGNPTIEEDCRDPFFPSTARLTWTFSGSTGLPMQVRLPVRLLVHNGIAYETAKFDQFASQGNLLSPSQVTVVRPTGQTEEFQIGRRSFVSALPANTFARP